MVTRTVERVEDVRPTGTLCRSIDADDPGPEPPQGLLRNWVVGPCDLIDMNWHQRDIDDVRRTHVTSDRRLGAAQVEVAQRT